MMIKRIPVWKEYEEYILEILIKKFPGRVFKADDSIKGIFSKTNRQVDISVKDSFLKHNFLGIVECKHLDRKIDVQVVDSFVGFLEDVGANIGIIITNKGFSDAAKNRANRSPRIFIDVIELEKLEEYIFPWDVCQICDPGPDRPPPLINWEYPPYGAKLNGVSYIVDFGRCSWCNEISVKCHSCGVVTPIAEEDLNKIVECEGSCGLKFRINRKYDKKSLPEDEFEIFK